MKQNVHQIERLVRVLLGVGLLAFALIDPSNYWFFLGILPLLTGLVGWCPPYALLGFNTCDLGKKSATK
ncbi:MAG: DUF2892 domain-containing protein [Bdellovibrionales bacterium]